jgi:ankyrin repeat protein
MLRLAFQKWKARPSDYGQHDLDALLLQAVSENSAAVAAELLAHGADANAVDAHNCTALEIAAADDSRLGMIRLLLEHGARTEKPLDSHGTTALQAALIKSAKQAATVLIESGCCVAAVRENDESALYLAAQLGDADLLKLMLQKGATRVVNVATARYSTSPLFAAIYKGSAPCVDLLLRHGAFVNVHNARNETPLGAAIRLDLADIARLLLQAGADPNMPAGKDGESPLALSIVHKRPDIAKDLIAHGADPAATDGAGRSALGLASREGNAPVLRHLLAHLPQEIFAAPEFTLGLYDTVFYNHGPAAALLLKSGRADPNLRTQFNRSALEAAVENNNLDMARLLLICGADSECPNSAGKKPAEIAAERGFTAIRDTLTGYRPHKI